MRIAQYVCGFLLIVLSGCQSPLAGTWVADKSSSSRSPIARVSFVNDGTFTAEAEYPGGQTRAMSGRYTTNKGVLELDIEGHKRTYPYQVNHDVLTMQHENTSAQMVRVKNR